MKKYKLGIIPYIVVLCLLAFFILKIRDFRSFAVSTLSISKADVDLIDSSTWNELDKNTEKVTTETALMIYSSKEPSSFELFENIKYVLETMNVKVVEKDINNSTKVGDINTYKTIVLCTDNVADIEYSKAQVSKWLNAGNGMIFGMPLLVNIEMGEYLDIVGIQKQADYEVTTYKDMKFIDDFVLGLNGKSYGEQIISGDALKANLLPNTKVHITTVDGTLPMLWTLDHGKGRVLVANCSVLQEKIGRGVVSAAYCELHETYVYPVINASVYYIDDFPSPIPVGYDEKIFKQYGYNMDDFYFNIWWPRIKKFIEEDGIKITGTVIQTYENKVDPPYDNDMYRETSKYYANEILKVGCEMGLHGYNHQSLALSGFDYMDEEINYLPWKNLDNIFEATRAGITYGKELAPNAKIVTYVAPSNIISKYVMEAMEKNIEELKVYAGVYIGTEAEMVQEFEAKENGIVYVPRTNSGMDALTNPQIDYLIANEVAYHFAQTNFIHPDDILDPERNNGKDFENLCANFKELITKMNSYKLRNLTAAEAGGAVQRYQLTTAKQEKDGNKINLKIEGIYDKVYYMLRLSENEKLKSINGAKYNKLAENYYVLEIDKPEVTIELE